MDTAILLSVIDDSMDDDGIPVSTDLSDAPDVIKTNPPTNTVGYEQKYGWFPRCVNSNYYKVSANEMVKNPLSEYLRTEYGDRNIFMHNKYRGSIRQFLQSAYENDPSKHLVAKLVHTPLSTNYPYILIKNYFDTASFDFARMFNDMNIAEECYSIDECRKTSHKYSGECATDKYIVYKIPKDFAKKLSRITYYWNEVKDKLVLDPDTGYYCYLVYKKSIVNDDDSSSPASSPTPLPTTSPPDSSPTVTVAQSPSVTVSQACAPAPVPACASTSASSVFANDSLCSCDGTGGESCAGTGAGMGGEACAGTGGEACARMSAGVTLGGKAGDVLIPIICKHQAMILDGVPIGKIAMECYVDGVCKYCGQEVIAYNDGSDFVLPPAATSLIISFADVFRHKYSTENIIYDVNDYIVKKLQRMGVSEYSTDDCVVWTCLIIIKAARQGMAQLNIFETKMKKLIDKLSKQLSVSGKTQEDVNEILASESLSDIDVLINTLKNDGVSSKQEDISPENHVSIVDEIIFGSKNKKAETNIQRYYLARDGKMYEIYLALKTLLDKQFNGSCEVVPSATLCTNEMEDVKHMISTHGYDFFARVAKVYCPVNYLHEFSGKTCKHCGLEKSLKNIDDVYNKYSVIINNINTDKPKIVQIVDESKLDEQSRWNNVVKEIKATDDQHFQEVLRKYVDYVSAQKLLEKAVVKNNEYIDLASTVLNVPKSVLSEKLDDKNDMKRLFCFLLSKQEESVVVNNFLVCFSEIIDPKEFLVKE